MTYRSLITFYLLIACSCSHSTKNNLEDNASVISIDITDLQTENNYQSIINATDSLLLQEDKDNIIGEIDKIIFADSSIFLLDRKKARKVFMHHIDGSFVRSIGDLGAGVDEFLAPDGLCIDPEQKEIVIVDKNNRIFLFYNYEGEFLRSLKHDKFINDFLLYDKDKLIIDSGNIPNGDSCSLTIINKQTGKTEGELYAKNIVLQNMPFMSLYPLSTSNNKIIYQPSMSNSIYEIQTNNSLNCKYKIDFGSYWPSIDKLEQLKDKNPNVLVNELKTEYVLFPSLLETDQTIFVCFSHKNDLYTFFKDKENGKSKLFIWDKNSEVSLPIAVVNNKFVSIKYSEIDSPIVLFYNIKI